MEKSGFLPQKLYKKIGISFIALTIILVLVVVYFSFSQATVNLSVDQEQISVDFMARVMPAEDIDGYTGTVEAVPGGVYSTTVRGSQTFQSTGGSTGDAQAMGKVTIINNYSKVQPLVATTRLLTPDGILFRLSKRVDVPAGGKVEAEVYADQPGKQGEIGPTKFTIPGLWPGIQDKIYAESYEPMTGGVRQLKSIQQADLDRATETLSDNLYQEAVKELQKKYGQDFVVSTDNSTRDVSGLKYSAQAGDQATEFNVEMTVKLIVVDADQNNIVFLAEKKLRDNVPADRELGSIDPRSLKYTVEKYDLNNSSADIKVYMTGGIILRSDSLILDKDKIMGMSRSEAEDYFHNFSSVKSVEIKFSPFWVQKIPNLRDHIEININ